MAENLIFEIPFLEKIDRNPQKPPESQSSFPQFLEKLNDFLLDLEFVWLKFTKYVSIRDAIKKRPPPKYVSIRDAFKKRPPPNVAFVTFFQICLYGQISLTLPDPIPTTTTYYYFRPNQFYSVGLNLILALCIILRVYS